MAEGPRILVSACLLGAKVRYDGRAKTLMSALLDDWQARGWVVALCPEVAVGLPTPRPPVEIEPGKDAARVLRGKGRVLDPEGGDHTAAFVWAAELARDTARAQGCRFALLTDGSPTCGSTQISDGTHTGRRVDGIGLAAHLLRQDGVQVFAPHQIDQLAAALS